MVTSLILVTFLLTAGNFAHCQDWENLLFIKMEEVLQKQEAALQKQEAALNQLQKQEAALKDMQEKQGHTEDKLQEMQEKLEHVENNLQELHHEMDHLKGAATDNQDSLQNIWAKLETLEGIHQETKDCLGREDLESFKNISSAGRQELESSLRQEIAGVISLLETGGIDECSEGSHNCGDHEACTDKLFKYGCSCLPGFARNGSHCEDIDECAHGKAECSPQAACRNSVGSYSCSCNPTFEGDGRTCSCLPGFAQNGSHCDDMDECARGKAECSPQAACRNSVGSYSCSCNPPFQGDGRTCEFSCESPAKVIVGLGCVKFVRERKTWQEMKATCREAGWRLLQDFSLTSLREVGRAFSYYDMWIGVYEGKWLEKGIAVHEELWEEGYRTDPSRLCGFVSRNYSSSSFRVSQRDCSANDEGVCQVKLLS